MKIRNRQDQCVQTPECESCKEQGELAATMMARLERQDQVIAQLQSQLKFVAEVSERARLSFGAMHDDLQELVAALTPETSSEL